MPRFEEVRTAHAPRELCWELLTDVERTPEWLTIASRVEAAGELQRGQLVHASGSALGVSVDLRLTIAHLDPPTRYGWQLTDPVPVDITFDLADHEERATRLRATVEADLGHRPAVRVRVAVRVLRGELARSLDQLVELSEAAPLR
ncbi:SRPBCC family protein [Nitriliruptor alkaliphilus]|uniref:SRPBCC family protein n=1 Tax=Nitriliruptor alkaliphilus TaxID=427918 RepID=UPI00069672D5|nr:SRPBCC family protein [Nitriliruptor alkaliphilus]